VRVVAVADGALRVEQRPDPVAGPGQVVVRIRASGVNAADLMQRAGRYPAPVGAPADVPGLEFAGEVEDVGAGTARFSPGDRVAALVGGGGHAERAAVHVSLLMPVPEALDWPAAGGFVEVFATAHDALFTQAGLAPGERLLVRGAAGGVGVAAVQLAVAAGATVTGLVRHEEHRVRIEELGAGTDAAGSYDVVLELVGGADNLAADVGLLATGGRLVVIGVPAGATAEVDFRMLMQKRARISASTLRARPLEEKALVVRRLERHVAPLVERGLVGVPVHATYPLERAAEAYDAFAAGGKFGKIVLTAGG
jgi:NADPH:quinone reductase-like Zn-dependent oxidoreductase